MKKITEKFAKLIDVKSIVTILLTIVFCYLSITKTLTPEFMTVFTVVIAFYFGTQTVKKQTSTEE